VAPPKEDPNISLVTKPPQTQLFWPSLIPNFSFKGSCLGRVLTKPKPKKRSRATGQGLPLEPEVGFETSVGFGSSTAGGNDDG
jgi:hypothetical protein